MKPKQQPAVKPRRSSSAWLVVLVGVVASWLILSTSGPTGLQTFPLAPFPFGWNRVVIVHLGASLPLAWMLADALVRLSRLRLLLIPALVWVLVSIVLSREAPDALERLSGQFSDLQRMGIRVAWSFGLVFPWMLIARSVQGPAKSAQTSFGWAALILAGLTSVLPPALYAQNLFEVKLSRLAFLLDEQRIWSAFQLTNRLMVIRSDQQIPIHDQQGERKVTVVELTQQLARAAQAVASALAQPLPENATPDARLAHADAFFQIDEFQQAIETLKPLASSQVEAAARMTKYLQHQRKWEQSNQWARRTLELMNSPDQSVDGNVYLASYVAMAVNDRERKQYREAEQVLREGLDQLSDPQSRLAAEFHLQLADHYKMGGRPMRALQELKQMPDRFPDLLQRASAMEAQMQHDTPLCIFKPTTPTPR